MNIGDILKQEMVLSELKGASKTDVLKEMAQHLSLHTHALNHSAETILQALLTRERLGSTGVGEGVAIPHAKIVGIQSLMACFGRCAKGVGYDAIDAQPVRLVFMLLVPENSAGVHLKALARISRLLKNAQFRQLLLHVDDAGALYQAFVEEDGKHHAP